MTEKEKVQFGKNVFIIAAVLAIIIYFLFSSIGDDIRHLLLMPVTEFKFFHILILIIILYITFKRR